MARFVSIDRGQVTTKHWIRPINRWIDQKGEPLPRDLFTLPRALINGTNGYPWQSYGTTQPSLLLGDNTLSCLIWHLPLMYLVINLGMGIQTTVENCDKEKSKMT